ncbi:ABC transporter permease [Belnapia rosea]|uniref:ABC-2 type transport system permease protein n=1 Tax=Belnapia rosea TaxID=938405 RepID=A0A1G6W6V3_9PROT|nr:ABC transporter permease [Belnapia rosea]SDD61670.1 ABC-2 type transport system permease protein [Belnapia rosea]
MRLPATLANALHLGVKELRSLLRDPIMLVLIGHAFTLAIYTGAAAMPSAVNRATIAIVDEDRSPLSARIAAAFYPPTFLPPVMITQAQMDARMDAGLDTFALDIPPNFQRDLLAGRNPAIQLNVDATRMTQAFSGSGYVQTMVMQEVQAFAQRYRGGEVPPVDLVLRARFNPQLEKSWFGAIIQLINNITMLSIVLTGAALIREREHGTIEHLLVMPVTPFEIMIGKIWAMGLVVFAAATASLFLVVQGLLAVPVGGSVPLFLAGAALHLLATTSLGIVLGTVTRSMPQFGLLLILILLPLMMLSGGMTPFESMPAGVQWVMQLAPTTHFVALAQAILYRGAGLPVVWPQFAALLAIAAALFAFALLRFRRMIGETAG